MPRNPRPTVLLALVTVTAFLVVGAAGTGLVLGGSWPSDVPTPSTVHAIAASTAAAQGRGTDAILEATRAGEDPATAGTAGLDDGLVAAFELARAAAAEAGHTLTITSGHRTPEEQQQLLDEAVLEHGSLGDATRWVFPPERSMHVQGLAVDVGDGPAADWLAAHGSEWGLCHTLAWEWWHFEWRARWEEARSCPPEAQDPSEAPGA
jgi:D-alanyl-D-alanine carboxypeptidase